MVRLLALWGDWVRAAGFGVETLAAGLNASASAFQGSKNARAPQGAAALFVGYLREYTVLEQERPSSLERTWPALAAFGCWMREQRGIKDSTLNTYQPILVDFFISLGTDPVAYTAAAIRDFVLERAKPHGRWRARGITVATRAYLKYLVAMGQCPIGREHAVPSFANWQLATTPRFLGQSDIDRLLATCEGAGIRDRAMMHLCFAGGLRVSELVGVRTENLSLRHGASLTVLGKGRKERCLPLWKDTARDLRAWLSVRGAVRVPELFVNAQGDPMSRAGFEYVLDKHVGKAAENCGSLRDRRVSPHQLRHSCAVVMLQATRDIRKVALWLGHADIRTTEVYLRMDPSEKLEAVEAVIPPELRRGRFKAPDALIASLLSDLG